MKVFSSKSFSAIRLSPLTKQQVLSIALSILQIVAEAYYLNKIEIKAANLTSYKSLITCSPFVFPSFTICSEWFFYSFFTFCCCCSIHCILFPTIFSLFKCVKIICMQIKKYFILGNKQSWKAKNECEKGHHPMCRHTQHFREQGGRVETHKIVFFTHFTKFHQNDVVQTKIANLES